MLQSRQAMVENSGELRGWNEGRGPFGFHTSGWFTPSIILRALQSSLLIDLSTRRSRDTQEAATVALGGGVGGIVGWVDGLGRGHEMAGWGPLHFEQMWGIGQFGW